MAQLSAKPQFFEPYKTFIIRAKWDGRYVAGFSEIRVHERNTELIAHREDDNLLL